MLDQQQGLVKLVFSCIGWYAKRMLVRLLPFGHVGYFGNAISLWLQYPSTDGNSSSDMMADSQKGLCKQHTKL